MDNNNPNPVQPMQQPQPVQQGAQTLVSPQPNTTTPPPVASQQPEDNKKMIFWLIGGLVIVILLVGGIYWFLSRQQAESETAQQAQVTQAPIQTEPTLEEELGSVQIDEIEAEFSQVDNDLENL